MLKLLLAKSDFEKLDAKIQAEYKPRDGKPDEYELDLDGGNPTDRVAEFRNRNIELDKQLTALKKSFEGLDPVRVREVMARESEIMDGEVYKKDGLDKAVEKRTEAMRNEHAKALKLAMDRAEQMENELSKLRIDGALVEEATKLNILPEALELITSAHRSRIKLENGQPVIYEADGKTKRYGADGKDLTIKELVEGELKVRPFLFKPSKGAGSGGSDQQGQPGDGENPWDPKTLSKTKQMAMLGSDDPATKAKAKRMAAAHGVKLPDA